MSRPSVFIGSSSHGLKIAQAIQFALDNVCEVELWTQGPFGLSKGNLEALVAALARFDFAILALTPDDLVKSRGKTRRAPRDNVVFELGLFMGGLGRERTFMVYDRTQKLTLPTDLAGIEPATFEPHKTGNLLSALGAPCTRIQFAIESLGVREGKIPYTYARNKAFSFDEIKRLVEKVHRRMESEFRPDILVTMSGPGSIAACCLLALNTRNIPLFVSVTFPKSRINGKSDSLEHFLKSCKENQWRRISTPRWEIFLSETIFQFPAGTKVVVFDDRVLSGDSQILLCKELAAASYDVRRAAALTSPNQVGQLAWSGGVFTEDFELPWGPKDGRY